MSSPLYAQMMRLIEITKTINANDYAPTEEELDQILYDTKSVFTAEVYNLVKMLINCIRKERKSSDGQDHNAERHE